MSSTHQLSIGQKLRLPELKAAWLKFNQNSGNEVQVVQNKKGPPAHYLNVCVAAPKVGWKKATDTCRAHIEAKGPSRDLLTIASVDLNHTCDRANDRKRKRQHHTKDIACRSDFLDLCVPAKGGNAKQIIEMTKKSAGITMKTGQAHSVVKEMSNTAVEAQLGQFFWVPSLFAAYNEGDPAGICSLESSPCLWDRQLKQFCRCHLCLSIAKHFWKHACIRLLSCDGTFTRTTCFKHIPLIATTHDANNNVTVLTMAVVECENAHN